MEYLMLLSMILLTVSILHLVQFTLKYCWNRLLNRWLNFKSCIELQLVGSLS